MTRAVAIVPQDVLRRVLRIIAELEQETGTADERVALATITEKENLPPSQARRLVGQLTQEGRVYCPREGRLKRTTPGRTF